MRRSSKRLLSGVLLALSTLLSTTAAEAQALRCPDPCPNQGRTLLFPSGVQPGSTQTAACAQFTISVLGVTISSPASCPSAYTWRADDVFQCGGQLVGHCCNPTANKVALKNFGPDGDVCPAAGFAVPPTVAEAFKLMSCKAPKLANQTFTWSAKPVECRTGKKSTQGEVRHGEARGAYVGWFGSPDAQLPPADPQRIAGWFAPLEDMPAGDLASPMREVWLSAAPLPAVDGLIARVIVKYGGANPRSFEYDVVGRVAADGRFAVTSTSLYGSGGEEAALAIDLSYDHKALFVGQVGSDYYSAFASSRPDLFLNLATIAMEALPLVDWVQGPFRIPRWSQVAWTTELSNVIIDGSAQDVLRMTAVLPGPGAAGRRVYDVAISGNQPRLLRFQDFDASNLMTFRKTFGEYGEIEPGMQRPFRVTSAWFEPGADEPFREESVLITEARPVALDAVKSWRLSSSANKWFVFVGP